MRCMHTQSKIMSVDQHYKILLYNFACALNCSDYSTGCLLLTMYMLLAIYS